MKGSTNSGRCGRIVTAAGLLLISWGSQAADHAPDQTAGRVVYEKWCAPCHAPGVQHPGTNALTVKYQGVKSGVLLEWRDLPAATVKFWVRHGLSVMPQFRKTEISDAELDALARYLSRNTAVNKRHTSERP
jgi:mono/diheme cytochrome c family protein